METEMSVTEWRFFSGHRLDGHETVRNKMAFFLTQAPGNRRSRSSSSTSSSAGRGSGILEGCGPVRKKMALFFFTNARWTPKGHRQILTPLLLQIPL